MKNVPRESYIIEFYHIGNSVKVSAIDPVSLTEVSIIGSPHMHEDVLKRRAVEKLEFVLKKKKENK